MNMQSKTNVAEDNGDRPTASARLEEEPGRSDSLAQLKQELRAPLDAIIGSAKHLETQCDDARMANDTKQILKAAHDLARHY